MKRIISIIVTACMIMSLMPIMAFADQDVMEIDLDMSEITVVDIEEVQEEIPVSFLGVATPSDAGPVPYAIFNEDNNTLTFGYGIKPSNGWIVEVEKIEESRGSLVPWNEKIGAIHNVIIENSFKDYRPTTTAYLFYGFEELRSIAGLENIDTSEVTNMSYMFANIGKSPSISPEDKLRVLDLSNFDTKKVTYMTSMFMDSETIQTIYVDPGKFVTSNLGQKAGILGNSITEMKA